MATHYEYHRFVLQPTIKLFEGEGDPGSCYANISRRSRRSRKRRRRRRRQKYCATILRAIPCWGKATKNRAELMNELRSYWKKKVILETTPLPEDVVNLLQEYCGRNWGNKYPYPKTDIHGRRIHLFQDDGSGIWHSFNRLGRMEPAASTLARRQAMREENVPTSSTWGEVAQLGLLGLVRWKN